ncbi:MAG: D-alanine--D-alanine ligase [candidate division WOR-3 bacterium]
MKLEEIKKLAKDKDIVVICGGWSGEREVSLRSGKGVYESLLRQGFKARIFDLTPENVTELKPGFCDIAFIILHGKPGEDGTIQGLLELMGIPYTGSGVMASAIGMDKIMTKHVLKSLGINTPPYYFIPAHKNIEIEAKKALQTIGIPSVIKPRREGSSLGVYIVHSEDEFYKRIFEVHSNYGDLYIEKFIRGKAVTCGVLGTGDESFALPILELEVIGREFYDYTAKYTKGLTNFVIPARISEKSTTEFQNASLQLHKTIGCRGFSRTDGIVDENGNYYVLEINTLPGMTELSDLPKEAAHIGISYDEVVLYILKSAFE